MTTRDDGVAATLAALDRSRPFALFIRHAEREELPPDDPYADVDLTPAGSGAADALGRALQGALAWAASSPFLRCHRTARALVRTPLAVEDDTRLGRHGPWILDPEGGAQLFAALGHVGVVRAQIAGARWPCLRSLPDGVRVLLSCAADRLDARGSGVCVSHDAVLMPAIASLTGERFEASWLAPLDGFALQREGERWLCTWAGSRFEVA